MCVWEREKERERWPSLWYVENYRFSSCINSFYVHKHLLCVIGGNTSLQVIVKWAADCFPDNNHLCIVWYQLSFLKAFPCNWSPQNTNKSKSMQCQPFHPRSFTHNINVHCGSICLIPFDKWNRWQFRKIRLFQIILQNGEIKKLKIIRLLDYKFCILTNCCSTIIYMYL
jgi:hypothetical protein